MKLICGERFLSKYGIIVIVTYNQPETLSDRLRAAPIALTALIHHMHVRRVHFVAYGCGAEMVVKCILTYPKFYQKKHILYNYDTSVVHIHSFKYEMHSRM